MIASEENGIKSAAMLLQWDFIITMSSGVESITIDGPFEKTFTILGSLCQHLRLCYISSMTSVILTQAQQSPKLLKRF